MKNPITYLLSLLLSPALIYGQAQEPTIDNRPDLIHAIKATPTGPLKTGFRKNMGQLLNSHDQVDTTIAYYSESDNPKMWLSKEGALSWSTQVSDQSNKRYSNGQIPDPTESAQKDTLLRMDLIPVHAQNLQPVKSAAFPFEPTPDQAHYYLPHCGKDGIEHVPAYKKILWPDLYKGIHQQVNLTDGSISVHYIISPGADANTIRLQWKGFDRLSVSSKSMAAGFNSLELRLSNQTAYELDQWGRMNPLEWEASWVKNPDGTLGLITGSYNPDNTLVLPMSASRSSTSSQTNSRNLTYSTYLAGNGEDHLIELMTESDESVYAAGYTSSQVFPNSPGKGLQYAGGYDCFAMRFDLNMKLQISTFYGSSAYDQMDGSCLNEKDHLYMGGITTGYDLFNSANSKAGLLSGFIAHFDDELLLQESTYYGGDNSTVVTDVENHTHGVVITGYTITADSVFPLMFGQPQGWFQSDMAGADDGFIAQFSEDLTLKYSSFFGGSGSDKIYRVKRDGDGNLYFLMNTTTQDYYVDCKRPVLPGEMPLCSQLSNTTQSAPHGGDDYYVFVMTPQYELLWSTWLGGSLSEEYDRGADLVVNPDRVGDFYLAVSTENPTLFDLPLSESGYQWTPENDATQQLLLIRFEHFNPTWSTFAGCHNRVSSHGILEMDHFGNVYLSGNTSCQVAQPKINWCQEPDNNEFPICDNRVTGDLLFVQTDGQGTAINRGKTDAFLMGFNPRNELFWSTWFGGTEDEGVTTLTFNSNNHELYLGGVTTSPNKSIPLKKPGSSASHFQDKFNGTMGAMLATYTPVIATYVTDLENADQLLKVWPNPTQNWIHLELESSMNDYSIFSYRGELLKQGKISSLNPSLDVSDLPVGQYVLKIDGAESQSQVTFIRQ